MRILIVTADYLPGLSGIATLSFEQAAGLATLRHDVIVLTTTPGAADYTAASLFQVVEVPAGKAPIVRLSQLRRSVSKAIDKHRPDFIWCTNYRGFGLPVMLEARRRRISYGLYVHGTEVISEYQNLLRRRILHSVAAHAALVATNSCYTCSLLKQHYRISGLVVTPGVHLPASEDPTLKLKAATIRAGWMRSRPGTTPDTDRTVLLSSCRLSPEKGISTVLQALALLATDLRDRIIYVIGGSGPLASELETLAEELGLYENVIFSGCASRLDYSSILHAADIYVQPSQPYKNYVEGFGISFLEAQAAGLPCIASDWCGIPEAIKCDETGLLIPCSNPQETANAISRAIRDVDWRESAGAKARLWAAANTWDRHVGQLSAAITKVVTMPAALND